MFSNTCIGLRRDMHRVKSLLVSHTVSALTFTEQLYCLHRLDGTFLKVQAQVLPMGSRVSPPMTEMASTTSSTASAIFWIFPSSADCISTRH